MESSTSRLLDLPLELFRLILDHLIPELGICQAWRLRRISRIFAQEVLDCVVDHRIIERQSRKIGCSMGIHGPYLVGSRLAIEYMTQRVLTDQTTKTGLVGWVRDLMAELQKRSPSSNIFDRKNVRSLISAYVKLNAARGLYASKLVELLTQLTACDKEKVKNPVNVITASIILGLPLSSAEITEISGSKTATKGIFGLPLLYAAARGDLELVSALMQGQNLCCREGIKSRVRRCNPSDCRHEVCKALMETATHHRLEAFGLIIATSIFQYQPQWNIWNQSGLLTRDIHESPVRWLIKRDIQEYFNIWPGHWDEVYRAAIRSGPSIVLDLLMMVGKWPSNLMHLSYALRCGNSALVSRHFREYPEDVNDRHLRRMWLLDASYGGCTSLAREMIESRASFLLDKCELREVWMIATMENHVDIIRALLKEGHLPPKSRFGRWEHGLLITACNRGYTEIAELLLVTSLEHAIEDRQEINFALCLAASQGFSTIVRMFIERGVDVDGDGQDEPPLLCAQIHEQTHVVKLLKELGAKSLEMQNVREQCVKQRMIMRQWICHLRDSDIFGIFPIHGHSDAEEEMDEDHNCDEGEDE